VVARQDILEAMTGIALVLDRDLRVVAGGWRNWSDFWHANGGDDRVPAVVGQDLTSALSAGAVRCGFRAAMGAVARGERRSLQLPFRCDAPGLRRDMLLSVTRSGGEHLLYHAIPLAETKRAIPLHPQRSADCCAICCRAAAEPADPLDWAETLQTSFCQPAQDICPRCTLTLMSQAA
jgi:hypothetical protein